jgi:hypothetical protein
MHLVELPLSKGIFDNVYSSQWQLRSCIIEDGKIGEVGRDITSRQSGSDGRSRPKGQNIADRIRDEANTNAGVHFRTKYGDLLIGRRDGRQNDILAIEQNVAAGRTYNARLAISAANANRACVDGQQSIGRQASSRTEAQ